MSSHRARSFVFLAALGAVASAWPGTAVAFVWPNVPDQVERALAGGDVAERRQAASRLRELPAEIAVRLARQALGDPDTEVRLKAAQATTLLRVARSGDWVTAWLQEGDARLRLAACEVIRVGPTERSVVALGRVLGDPDARVRLAAAVAMGGSMLPAAVSPLLGHLDDSAPEVRAEVARALGHVGDPRAVAPLLGKVQDSAAEVRRVVAHALGELGDARAAGALMLALADGSEDVRVEAVTALGRLRADEATGAIAPLAGVDWSERSVTPTGRVAPTGAVASAALRALGAIGSDAAVNVLIRALANDDPASARSVMRSALVGAGKGAVRPLVAALAGSPAPNVAAGAALVLGELGAREGESAIIRAMQSGALQRSYGLRALKRLGSPSALPSVLELLPDADAAVRREAISAATTLLDVTGADGRAVDPAMAALGDPSTPLDERIGLVRLLGKAGSLRTRAVLSGLVKSKSLPLRLAALDALGGAPAALVGAVGASDVDALLVGAVEDESAEVRLHAAMALARVASPATAVVLFERLIVAAEQDRGALEMAVSGAMVRVVDPAFIERVGAALASAPDSAWDALVEGLGRARGATSGRVLERLAKSGSIAQRRKVAEALAGHPESIGALRSLAGDADPSVRANAMWSLGAIGGPQDLALLVPVVRDPDLAVAGNAAAALGRIAARTHGDSGAAQALCAALGDARSYVRANAVEAASLAALPCAAVSVVELLGRDLAEAVRLAAADALGRTLAVEASTEAAASGHRALERCIAEERSSTVASRCALADAPAPAVRSAARGVLDEVSVFVVPEGRSAPVPRAPFALVRPDGLLRLGVADRRGSVFELAIPRGTLTLAVPAPLQR